MADAWYGENETYGTLVDFLEGENLLDEWGNDPSWGMRPTYTNAVSEFVSEGPADLYSRVEQNLSDLLSLGPTFIKESAKAAGMSVMDWLGAVAFQGSQNPQGLGQEVLGAISYPFRKTAEVSMDYLNPWSTVDEQGSPVGLMHSEQMPEWLSRLNDPSMRMTMMQNPGLPLAGAVLGGFGIPINKWAEGEDVLKGDVLAGVASLGGPIFTGTVKGAGKVAQKTAPTTFDASRRKLLQAAGSSGLLALGGAGLVGRATKVASKAKLGASTIGRGLAGSFFGTVGTLLKQAETGVPGPATTSGAGVVKAHESMPLSPSSKIRLGNEERSIANFFTKFARAAENNMGRSDVGFIDPESGMPIKPKTLDRIDDHTFISDLNPPSSSSGYQKSLQLAKQGKREGNVTTLKEMEDSYWKYLRGVTKAIDAGDEPISGISEEAVDIVNRIVDAQKKLKTVPDLAPGIVDPMYEMSDALDSFWRTGRVDVLEGLDDVTVNKLVQQRQIWELDRAFTNRLDTQLQDVKWGMAHLEHLEKTDPERLKAILTDMTNIGEDATSADIARKMLEALQ
jgi:hypothetical protein